MLCQTGVRFGPGFWGDPVELKTNNSNIVDLVGDFVYMIEPAL